MDIDDVFLMKVMLASLEPVRCWPGAVGSGVELHRPGNDRCCPTRASSSGCPEDGDSCVLREQGVCGVCGERWRRRLGRWLGVDSVRDGVLLTL